MSDIESSPEAELAKELSDQGVIIRRGKSGSALSVDFREATEAATEHNLNRLLHFEKLRELHLANCSISDSQIEFAAQLSKLQTIDLQNTRVTDGCFTKLQSCQNLKMLLLTGANVSQDGLAEFRKKMIGTRIVFLS